MGLVLVECRARDLGRRDERGQPLAGLRQRLDVEVGQRDDRADVVLGDEPLEEWDVVGVVDPRRADGEVRGIARGCQRVRDRRRS